MIKLADTLAPMADFPAVMAEHTAFEDGETLQEKYETGQLGGGGGGYTQLSQAEYDALTDDEKMNGKEYRTYDTGHIYKLGVEYGKEDAIYTSLAELGLTAPITVGEIFNAMPNKTMAILSCEDIANHITDVPTDYGVLTIKKNGVGRFSIEYQNSTYNTPCNVKKWIGTLKGADGTGLTWKELATMDKVITNTWIPFSNLFEMSERQVFQESWNATQDYNICDGFSDVGNEPWWRIIKRPGDRISTGYIESRAGFFLLRHDANGWFVKKLSD